MEMLTFGSAIGHEVASPPAHPFRRRRRLPPLRGGWWR